MNDVIEECDSQFRNNLSERIYKMEKDCTNNDNKTISMAIDRLNAEKREYETKNHSLKNQ